MENVPLSFKGTEFISITTINDPEEQFFVDKILKKIVVDNQVLYFVQWKNYGDENTWDLLEDLHCIELISEFEENFMGRFAA